MSGYTDLVNVIDHWRDVRVLCIGDVMQDRFVLGKAERISPEAPVPVLRIEGEDVMLGGVGNVVRNVAAIGARSVLLSVIGDDEPGRALRALLDAEPTVEPGLVEERGRRTTVKTRFVADGQQLLRADSEVVRPATAEAEAALVARCTAELRRCQVVVVSDYGKGVVSPSLVAAILAAAGREGRPVIVDPKGMDYSRYRRATVLTPNRSELAQATRMPVQTDEQIVAAARTLIESLALGAVLVTRSEQGMTLVAADGTVDHVAATAREVFDVSGAGDTAVAVLASAVATGAPLSIAARLANVAAGIVVGKVGTATVRADELQRAVLGQQSLEGASKIMSWPEAAERIGQWRRGGLKVGFTNGCFDLLHPGHVSLLMQAKRACDRLIVGLNSDDSVSRLKGPERPIQQELARATVLASLASVDGVVLFDQDTPLELLQELRPDVLVKGADYAISEVVGADLVQSYGGRVVLAELVPQQSTTKLVGKMRSSTERVA